LKTLKDFLSSEKPVVSQVEETMEPIALEAVESVNETFFDEDSSQKQMDPPNILIMRRKSVRQFPNGQRVALYYVDKIDKYVTVPYTASQWSSTGAMDTEQ
jgi:hypothetical protein